MSVLIFAAPSLAQQSAEPSGIQAHLKLQSLNVAVGRPIWATLSLVNTSDKPITLTVDGAEVLAPSLASGLPLAHVFSGRRASGLTVQTSDGRSKWEVPKGFKAPKKAPALTLSHRQDQPSDRLETADTVRQALCLESQDFFEQ